MVESVFGITPVSVSVLHQSYEKLAEVARERERSEKVSELESPPDRRNLRGW